MKKLSIILSANAAAFILISITVMALGFCHLDTDRKTTDRQTYAQFIKESAMPFKDLKVPQESDKEKFDAPDLASLQDFFMTMDPVQKRVTAERLPTAYRQLLQIQSKQLKPGGYELEWTGTETEMGGRTRAIMWDPLVDNKVWAGSVTGGLWYNDDITSWGEWHPVNDMWDNLVISCITCDPNNPQIMYVGTGEAQTALITYRESGGRGVGIWMTTDGGMNWTLMPSTSPFAYVTKIVVRNESGSSVIYAGVVSGYYHGLQQSQPTDGLYRSTDGGETWEQVLPLILGDTVPYAPNNISLGADGRIYVGTMQNAYGNGGGVVLYSDNGTSGTWSIFEDVAVQIRSDIDNPLPGRVEIATSASDANVIYAAFASGVHSPGTQPVYKGAYIYRSDDKGVTWNPVNLPGGSSEWANLAWHAMVIAVDPNDPNSVYAGGLDEWRTTDGGTTWNQLTDWVLMYYGGGINYIHADQHAIVYKPGSSNSILFGSDGGIFYTASGNATQPMFEELNYNYNTLQFYSGAIHPAAGKNKFIGGLQDNGSLLYDDAPLTNSSIISGGDGAYCFWDKETPLVYVTSSYYNMYYMFNNGILWNLDGYYRSGVFVNPADYYSSENTIFANATDFWGGMADSILVIDNIPSNTNVYFINAGTGTDSYFSQVKVSPFSIGSSPTLFLGTVSGKLFKVTDVLSDPITTDIGSPAFPPGNISNIAVGGSEDTLLVTFSNYGVSSIWQTYDGGQMWNEVEGNLPDMPVRWALYHPQNSKQVLIATELGVWSTNNVQDTTVVWTPQNAGMANIRVDMLTLRTSDNTVLAATHGRGLFTCKFYLDNPKSTPDLTEKTSPFIIFKSETGIEIKSTTNQSAEYTVYSIGGSEVLKGELEAGIVNHTVNVNQLSHGVYLVKVQSGNTKLVKKVVL